MLGLAAIPLDVACRFLDPAADPPAAAVGEVVRGAWDDSAALDALASGVDAVTWEIESVPAAAAEHIGRRVPVRPSPDWLRIGGTRSVEKARFVRAGLDTAGHRPVADRQGVHAALGELGAPLLLKTSRLGYDGRGQRLLRGPHEVDTAWEELGLVESPEGAPVAIAEELVPFTRELSVIAVCASGDRRQYPVVETRQRGGQLHSALAPAPGWTAQLQERAEAMIDRLLAGGDDAPAPYTGVLALELFEAGGRLLANELAPRVHNSGHWSIEGAVCSQFENHVRAVCGMPLGEVTVPRPAAVVNLIGRLPDVAELLRVPGAHVHLYGKAARPGRKLGHVTVTGSDEEERDALLARLEEIVDRH